MLVINGVIRTNGASASGIIGKINMPSGYTLYRSVYILTNYQSASTISGTGCIYIDTNGYVRQRLPESTGINSSHDFIAIIAFIKSS